MMHYFLNIGSNLGNRKLNLSRAVAALEREFGYFEISKTVESEPWGFDSTNFFLNVAMMVISDLEPIEVLRKIKGIEKRLNPESHRKADGSYADRVIDIDIMAADEIELHTEELTLPHPHLAERLFFLQPMAELAPAWHHPATGLTPGEMLSLLRSEGRVSVTQE